MILITGATGIVGSHILVELLKRGQRTRALVRRESDFVAIQQLLNQAQLKDDNVEYVEGDVTDPLSLVRAVSGCQDVYHCAAMVSFSPADLSRMNEVNVVGTSNVVNASLAEGIKRLCYISSTAAIGDELISGYLSEQSGWTSDKHRSGYSLSKRYAELEVQRGRQEGLSAVIVNPGIIIGAGQWGKSSTSMIVSCRNGMRFYPTGSNGFVDARDVARFSIEAIEKGLFEGRYLLVGENASYHRIFTLICESLGAAKPSIKIPKALANPVRRVLYIMDLMRINPFGITAETMQSAYRNVRYDNSNATALGFKFHTMEEAVGSAVSVYQTNQGS
ncbi:MAG: NAD-dependent epimerase/dehydratase family protein [Flavobacteriales bacterium]